MTNATTENVEEVDNFKWRTPVKLVTYTSLILDAIVVLALAIGLAALFYPPLPTSPWALVAVKPFESFSRDDWHMLIVFMIAKVQFDLLLLWSTAPGQDLHLRYWSCILFVINHFGSVIVALESEIRGLIVKPDSERKAFLKDLHAVNIIIVIYYSFCLYPVWMWMFMEELKALLPPRFQTKGTDPPSPEEMRGMSWTWSEAQEETGSEMSEDEEWERSVIDLYS